MDGYQAHLYEHKSKNTSSILGPTCASACLRCHAGLLLESHDQLLLRGEGAQVHPVGPELGSSCHGGSLLAVVILHLGEVQ